MCTQQCKISTNKWKFHTLKDGLCSQKKVDSQHYGLCKCACPVRLHLWADGLMITKPAVWESLRYNCVATQSALRDDVNGQRASASLLFGCQRVKGSLRRGPLSENQPPPCHMDRRRRFTVLTALWVANDSDQSLKRVSPAPAWSVGVISHMVLCKHRCLCRNPTSEISSRKTRKKKQLILLSLIWTLCCGSLGDYCIKRSM